MLQRKDVVVFDFDGTLSASDSNYEFFKYCFKHSLRPWLFLPCIIAGQIAKTFNPYGLWWRQTIRCFMTPKMVEKFADKCIKQHRKRRFPGAKALVDRERKRGNKVVLVSAGPDFLIPELVSDIKFDAVICSQMRADKPYKYKFLCWGRNKVIALDRWARYNKYIPNVVRSYADSKSDTPLMEIAKERVWINPRTGKRK